MHTLTNDHPMSKPAARIRILDSIDRGHARAADGLHTVRNSIRGALDSGLDRLERAIEQLRERLELADTRAANGIIRAQGFVGGAIEKARSARTADGHAPSV